MKISMISEHASPLAALGGVDAGGQNVHVAELSRALSARGHDVTVFTRRDSPSPAPVVHSHGVTVVHIDAGPDRYVPKDDLLPYIGDLGAGIADFWTHRPEHRPDLVHSHFWMSGVAARAALEGAGLTTVPVVHTFHALGSVKRRHQGAEDTSPAERRGLEPWVGQEVADRIIATCSDEVSELAAEGIACDKVDVVPCGVDGDLFSPGTGDTPSGDVRRIVTVGRLVPRKGADILIQALALLDSQRYGNIELHIIGGNDTEDRGAGSEATRLKSLAEELGIADKVVLRGQVPREEMPSALRGATIVACTPWYEPFGIVPLEAMACGVPVVASCVGGLADTVVDGITGVHVPPRDPDATAQAIAMLLDDSAQCDRLGTEGVRRIRQRYTWPTVARETEKVYTDVLARADGLVALDCSADLEEHLDGSEQAVRSLRSQTPALQRWGRDLAERLLSGGRLFTAGNGGSAAEAQHFSAEIVGRYDGERRAFSAIALTTDPSTVTAISNDYGYEQVFSRQLEGHATPGDVLLLLTTSGTSENLVRAAETARQMGVTTWALTGPGASPLSAVCDEVVAVDAPRANVQEAHLMIVHALCRVFDSVVARDTRTETAGVAKEAVS